MNQNVNLFFEKYQADEALRERCRTAVENYPGSLECREYLVEDVLLPIAEELGLAFTLKDLRAYDTQRKFAHDVKPDEEMSAEEFAAGDGDDYNYWLIGYGWSTADDVYKDALK